MVELDLNSNIEISLRFQINVMMNTYTVLWYNIVDVNLQNK